MTCVIHLTIVGLADLVQFTWAALICVTRGDSGYIVTAIGEVLNANCTKRRPSLDVRLCGGFRLGNQSGVCALHPASRQLVGDDNCPVLKVARRNGYAALNF